MLTWLATGHVEHALIALRASYRAGAVDLQPYLPPHVIADVLEVHRVEGRRLTSSRS